jgi:hypothetical protein
MGETIMPIHLSITGHARRHSIATLTLVFVFVACCNYVLAAPPPPNPAQSQPSHPREAPTDWAGLRDRLMAVGNSVEEVPRAYAAIVITSAN